MFTMAWMGCNVWIYLKAKTKRWSSSKLLHPCLDFCQLLLLLYDSSITHAWCHSLRKRRIWHEIDTNYRLYIWQCVHRPFLCVGAYTVPVRMYRVITIFFRGINAERKICLLHTYDKISPRRLRVHLPNTRVQNWYEHGQREGTTINTIILLFLQLTRS